MESGSVWSFDSGEVGVAGVYCDGVDDGSAGAYYYEYGVGSAVGGGAGEYAHASVSGAEFRFG